MKRADFFDYAAPGGSASVLSVGVFDGMHRGHQHLIGRAVERARSLGVTPIAVTFNPRPREVLRPDLPSDYLVTLDERLELLAALGVEVTAVIEFTREVAAIPAAEFVRRLTQSYRMTELWVGRDFALGHGRGGTIPVLRELGETSGFRVEVAEPFTLGVQVVSSTLIHQKLAEGDVRGAAVLLGRPVHVTGPVVYGAQRGRTINVPTANVAPPERLALPANGVYAVRAAALGLGERPALSGLAGVANIGTRPTFDNGARSVEAHLFDFSGDLYGQPLRVEFVERLRPEMKFDGVTEFLAQIQRDMARAREILS